MFFLYFQHLWKWFIFLNVTFFWIVLFTSNNKRGLLKLIGEKKIQREVHTLINVSVWFYRSSAFVVTSGVITITNPPLLTKYWKNKGGGLVMSHLQDFWKEREERLILISFLFFKLVIFTCGFFFCFFFLGAFFGSGIGRFCELVFFQVQVSFLELKCRQQMDYFSDVQVLAVDRKKTLYILSAPHPQHVFHLGYSISTVLFNLVVSWALRVNWGSFAPHFWYIFQ